jgi:hypothetical protein
MSELEEIEKKNLNNEIKNNENNKENKNNKYKDEENKLLNINIGILGHVDSG